MFSSQRAITNPLLKQFLAFERFIKKRREYNHKMNKFEIK